MPVYRIKVSHAVTTTYFQTLEVKAETQEEAEKLAIEGAGSPIDLDNEEPRSEYGESMPQNYCDYEPEAELLAIDGQPPVVAEPEDEEKYRMYYRHCGVEWQMVWSCACNDQCPKCGTKDIQPFAWEEGAKEAVTA
jgi:hypothetical protein